MTRQFIPYCSYSDGEHDAVAGFIDEDKGLSAVIFDRRPLLALPTDYVSGLHIHDGDLYVIYVRAILRVPDITSGNIEPEDHYTLEMQDYYSYEPPQMLTDLDGTLWAHIGGRLFRREGDGWAQAAEFPIGEKAWVPGAETLAFSKNLLRDELADGQRIYNIKTGQINETI